MVPAPGIDIINDGSVVDDRHISTRIISRETVVIDISVRHKYPPQIGDVEVYIDIHAGSHWGPSIIPSA